MAGHVSSLATPTWCETAAHASGVSGSAFRNAWRSEGIQGHPFGDCAVRALLVTTGVPPRVVRIVGPSSAGFADGDEDSLLHVAVQHDGPREVVAACPSGGDGERNYVGPGAASQLPAACSGFEGVGSSGKSIDFDKAPWGEHRYGDCNVGILLYTCISSASIHRDRASLTSSPFDFHPLVRPHTRPQFVPHVLPRGAFR